MFPVLRPREIRYVRFENPSPGPGGNGGGPGRKQLLAEISPPIKFLAFVLGVGGVYYVTHLEQVPHTGRWRFMAVGPQTEAQIGETVRRQLYQTSGNRILPPNHPITRHVRRVVSRILTASNLGTLRGEKRPEDTMFGFGNVFGGFGGFSTPDSDFGAATQPNESYGPEKEWDVIVVNDRNMVNAMAAPGVVVVFTGILPVCQDEEGLAAVLAHEIGHIVARHQAERLSSEAIWTGVALGLRALGLDWFVSRSISTLFLELPNSRLQELEADLIGLRLMSRACYNPSAAPAMFERLGKLEQALPSLEFIRTHPTSENRAKILEKALPEAYRILEDNPECIEVRKQINSLLESARAIRIDDMGGIERL
ncbi:peptidase M48 family protein [Coprinopsis cinerea okayama7|uniref:Peptidase M48 family protein n=1 Tax=Coprinopsis cinerea (strain Okayama-7 / 130 / ATCC MYA-4618 / FGSC 9003) TaxID=240176 RepID=A8PBH2_COPC7|nr:peptidase M48 family protein [Coprinopsis cinerea okayama7\|eukprot:XP_001840182.1 peptidase M48 family protein [Coprinopsis cinerea okayama7\